MICALYISYFNISTSPLLVAASELARQHFNDRDSSVVPEMAGKYCVISYIIDLVL